MAEITEARIAMADGREAIYVGEAADMPKLPEWPMIAISVKDFEEAQEIIATLDRSRARKRTGKEPEAAPEPAAIVPPTIRPALRTPMVATSAPAALPARVSPRARTR